MFIPSGSVNVFHNPGADAKMAYGTGRRRILSVEALREARAQISSWAV
jgi:hypothetical protein